MDEKRSTYLTTSLFFCRLLTAAAATEESVEGRTWDGHPILASSSPKRLRRCAPRNALDRRITLIYLAGILLLLDIYIIRYCTRSVHGVHTAISILN